MAGRRRAHAPDYILLAATGFFMVLGLLTIASASLVLSSTRFGEAYYFLSRQAVGVGVGIAALIAGWHIRYTLWRTMAAPLLVASLALMALVFMPSLGLELKGARRWVDIGVLSLQPGEIVKLSFIIYLAAWLEAKRKKVGTLMSGLLPFFVMLGIVSIFFILQPDIGTLGVLAAVSLLIFFIGGGRLAQIGLLLLVGFLALGMLTYAQPYRKDRLTVFLNPQTDTQGIGYQLNQALIAIGSGGFIGRGFGMSRQKFNYLPEVAGDSIFAVFGEEFGFLGSMVLVAAFLIFFWRGIRISARAPDMFGKLLAAGIQPFDFGVV